MAVYPNSRRVETSHGPIVGRRLIHEGDRQVDAFQGIPYAKPPVGPLRFKKPEPPECWTEVKECKEFGNRGVQKELPGAVSNVPQSEDCLNLNVFSPVWSPPRPSGFPVLVYVHGGGFIFDSADRYGDVNICETLVKKGVLVVTVQYRLGYFGLWTTGDELCPGNNLMWDLTLALKWIQTNIAKFNGDPGNITLSGQSAGGALVDLLSLSPHSRELFHKVICLAGNACDTWTVSTNVVEACRQKAASLGIRTLDSLEQLEELRKQPADAFALGLGDTGGKSENEEASGSEFKITPRIDGDFFPKSIKDLRKEAPVKPRIVGVCRDEGLLWLGDGSKTTCTIHCIAAARFPEKNFPKNFMELRREYVKRVMKDAKDDISTQKAICQALGDHLFTFGCQEIVIDSLETGGEVFLYLMDWFNPKMNGFVTAKAPFQGSAHCGDVAFLLRKGVVSDFEFTPEDDEVVEIVGNYFTNFMKYDNPNGDDKAAAAVKWSPATKDHSERHLRIDRRPVSADSFFDGRPRWLIETTKKHYEKA